jgi:hypothetical protein
LSPGITRKRDQSRLVGFDISSIQHFTHVAVSRWGIVQRIVTFPQCSRATDILNILRLISLVLLHTTSFLLLLLLRATSLLILHLLCQREKVINFVRSTEVRSTAIRSTYLLYTVVLLDTTYIQRRDIERDNVTSLINSRQRTVTYKAFSAYFMFITRSNTQSG